MKNQVQGITDQMIIRELRTAMKEIDIAWEYATENSPLDFAIAVPYCTIKNVINAIKIRMLMTPLKKPF